MMIAQGTLLVRKWKRHIAEFLRKKPPRSVPPRLLDAYTLKGSIPIEEWYFDGTESSDHPNVYTTQTIDSYMEKVKDRQTFYYGETDTWLYDALEKYSVLGLDVAVMGSEQPLYESICLAYGGHPVTIEYKRISCQDSRLKVMTPVEYDQHPMRFDAAFSISSFEHDGVGRYGDPLNPQADLDAMQKMRKLVIPGGIMYLAVPVGKDSLIWNAHRIYGHIRLPLFLSGWKVLDSFGFSDDLLDIEVKTRQIPIQPVFVLQNTA